MNPAVVATSLGLLTTALGCIGLFDPPLVMGFVGLAPISESYGATVLGEVRSLYGGLFIVIGGYTILAGLKPAENRGRLLFIGLMWLGMCSGRLFAVSIDGTPGLKGWINVVVELLMGLALVIASRARAPGSTATETEGAR